MTIKVAILIRTHHLTLIHPTNWESGMITILWGFRPACKQVKICWLFSLSGLTKEEMVNLLGTSPHVKSQTN